MHADRAGEGEGVGKETVYSAGFAQVLAQDGGVVGVDEGRWHGVACAAQGGVIGGVPVGGVGVQAAVFALANPLDVGGVAQLKLRQVELQHNRGNLGVRGGIEGRNGILGNRQLRVRDLWQRRAGRDGENLVLGIVAHLDEKAVCEVSKNSVVQQKRCFNIRHTYQQKKQTTSK